MSIIITALALTAAAQPATAPAAQPVDHAQHQQTAQRQDSKGCCCCDNMAEGKKMACCEHHDKKAGDKNAGHAGHSGQ